MTNFQKHTVAMEKAIEVNRPHSYIFANGSHQTFYWEKKVANA